MATIVNPAITDSITQSDTTLLAVNPAAITSNLMQVASHTTGLSMQNASNSQQQAAPLHGAATSQGLTLLYAVDTSATAQAVDTVNRSTDYSKMVESRAVSTAFPKPDPQYGGK